MDRIFEAYLGTWGGNRVQRESRERIDWLLKVIDGKRILDVGCSQGLLAILLAEKRDVEIVGIDILDEAIAYAQQALADRASQLKGSVTFRRTDFFKETPPKDNKDRFDTVVIGQVLEHLLDPAEFINHAAKFLTPEGRLILTVPYGVWEHDEHDHTFYARDFARICREILPITEMRLVGGRLTAILSSQTTQQLNEKDIVELEYDFFLAKERRYIASELELGAKAEMLARRTLSRNPIRVIGRWLRRLPHIVNDFIHPAQVRKLNSKIEQTKNALKQAYFDLDKQMAYRKTFRGLVMLRRIPALVGYKPSLERAQGRQHLLENGFPISPRCDAPAYVPVRSLILYALHFSLPYQTRGYATRTHELLTALRREAWDVEGVTRPGFPYDIVDPPNSAPTPETIGLVPYHRLGHPEHSIHILPLDAYLNAYADMLSNLVEQRRPILLHAASNYVNGLAAAEVAVRHGIPFIYEVRGIWELTRASTEPAFEGSAEHSLATRLEWEAMQAADCVLCLNGALKNYLVNECGIAASKIKLAPNAADPDRFPRMIDSPSNASGHQHHPHKMTVAYIGSILEYEGVDDFIEAIAILQKRGENGVNWLIVGDGPALAACKERAARNGLANIITFTGAAPFDEVVTHYANADILVCPRKSLPVCEIVTPVKIFEAFSSGKPVIVSNVDALKEVADASSACLVFEKGNQNALADQIAELIRDPERRKELGRAGRRFIETERNWRTVAQTIGATYCEFGAAPLKSKF